tara:strand:- start:1232 stop:1393 length:162 start_codon:yes stop_codon:yes gene_type:complete
MTKKKKMPTTKETETLLLYAEGKKQREMAKILKVSRSTIAGRIANLKKKGYSL